MTTLGALEGHKRCTTSTGTVTFTISDLNFGNEDDYEVLVLCGSGYPLCNNRAASPAVTTNKTATTFKVEVAVAPCCVLVCSTGSYGKSPVT
jgi:hypothetical protein